MSCSRKAPKIVATVFSVEPTYFLLSFLNYMHMKKLLSKTVYQNFCKNMITETNNSE